MNQNSVNNKPIRHFNDGKFQMAGSYDGLDKLTVNWIKKTFNENTKVLDVGAGSGKWYDYLNDFFTVKFDALQIYAPNIKVHQLEKKYHTVYNCNIIDFKQWQNYDLYIFGGIIEHLSVQHAQYVFNCIIQANKHTIIQIPFTLEQGKHHGNVYQIHLQPDLTPNIMKQRYPYLTLLIKDIIVGVYYI